VTPLRDRALGWGTERDETSAFSVVISRWVRLFLGTQSVVATA
jgi:hypothetical protein